MIPLVVILLLVPGCILGAFGSILLKKGAGRFTLNPTRMKDNVTVFFGMGLYGVSVLFYVTALRYENLSVIYPLSSFGYAIIALLSVKYLGEKMSLRKWTGITLILLGTFFLVR